VTKPVGAEVSGLPEEPAAQRVRPGSKVGRYTLVRRLGTGGMGVVYSAHDPYLGRHVALKLLRRAQRTREVAPRLLREAVALAQLSHPNVVAIYDVGVWEESIFLSMELVEGSTLREWLSERQRGWKEILAIFIEIAAGLGAAHKAGVLHLDIKPENILLDASGRVRITDFGLAKFATSSGESATEWGGTPAYMAPEQLAGKGASVRSDIYSLGLVLYELYTGRRAFTARSLAELREQKESSMLVAPSELRSGVDPGVERVIMRCLERDPRSRPASVSQVAAALPGGDPLAAAIAAGETPSPEMVAASGLKEGLRPAIAFALVAVIVAGALTVIALDPRTMLVEQARLPRPPQALAARGRDVLQELGYPAGADRVWAFTYNDTFLQWLVEDARRQSRLRTFAPVLFGYRESPLPLARTVLKPGFYALASPLEDPPMVVPGESRVLFDGDGWLRSLDVVPPVTRSARTSAPRPPDWAKLFTSAGLEIRNWREVAPRRNPIFYADAQAAWEGTFADAPEIPLRIEAAAYDGRPVSFRLIGPWTQEQPALLPAWALRILTGLGALLLAIVPIGGVFFARRNLRLGRGDRRGAFRLTVAVAALRTVSWLLSENHVAGPWEIALLLDFIAATLLNCGVLWVVYVALEPFVRRQWPHMLVSWTRLLAGGWRDPLVAAMC
jgi:serine/threonine-protein kinase